VHEEVAVYVPAFQVLMSGGLIVALWRSKITGRDDCQTSFMEMFWVCWKEFGSCDVDEIGFLVWKRNLKSD
jgi:hypothetical protein